MTAPRIDVLVNAAAGTGVDSIEPIKAQLSERNIEARFLIAETAEEFSDFVNAAADTEARVVVAAGGDGTISSVAASLVGTDKALGVVPLGTINNFSKDLGIPQNVADAVGVIAEENIREIDVGEVNGRYFINNSSIGLYPRIVRRREQQQRLGRGKLWAAAWGAWRFLWFSPFLKVWLKLDENVLRRKTPFVFVGNNEYEMDFYNIGRRSRLDGGKLSIYLLHRSGRTGLFLLVIRTLLGRLRQAKDFEELYAPELTVATRRKTILVALDGEVTVMNSPLEYRIHPRALRVLVPDNS